MAGKIVHFEVPSGDADRASGFYSGLFGYEIGSSVMDGFDYRMFQSAEDQGGAVMPSESAAPGSSSTSTPTTSTRPSPRCAS
jgi:predicted enzyme related to lactoylglutathione lyase